MRPAQGLIHRNHTVRYHEHVRLHDGFRREHYVGWRHQRFADSFVLAIRCDFQQHVADRDLMRGRGRVRHQQLAVQQFVARPMARIVHEFADVGCGPVMFRDRGHTHNVLGLGGRKQLGIPRVYGRPARLHHQFIARRSLRFPPTARQDSIETHLLLGGASPSAPRGSPVAVAPQ